MRESSSGKFGDRLHGLFGNSDEWFKSDHVFDGFISPVTNPFLFEDPRSLTEVRPIFMYQQIPGGQPDLSGGNIWFFGTQARVAFTDRLSFVFHKLGGISVNPGSGSTFDGADRVRGAVARAEVHVHPQRGGRPRDGRRACSSRSRSVAAASSRTPAPCRWCRT